MISKINPKQRTTYPLADMEWRYYSLENLNITLGSVYEQYCAPNHFNGPKIRESCVFHFIFSGKGTFTINGKTYHLSANQGFFFDDKTPIFYQADKDDPWHYGWITFTGSGYQTLFDRLSISIDSPIYTARAENSIRASFKDLMNEYLNGSYFSVYSAFFSYLYALEKFSATEHNLVDVSYREMYIKQAEREILLEYHDGGLKIDAIAKKIGIDRSYLSRLFVENFGVSPQEYLLTTRMERAKSFLQTTNFSIQTIANSVGYPNIDAFSKIFKKRYGLSPSAMRKSANFMQK